MFHQVKVLESDRDCLRFLWWPNWDLNRNPIGYRMTSHLFGATSSPTCAALALNQTFESILAGHDERKWNIAKRALYVDDCILNLHTPEEVSEMVYCLKDTLSRRGFNLTKFFSNVRGAIDAYPKAETKTLHLDQQPLNTKRTLGLEWDSESDCFVFAVEGWQSDSTRRSLLSYVALAFDPLGLVASCALPSKLLIQDLTRRKAD